MNVMKDTARAAAVAGLVAGTIDIGAAAAINHVGPGLILQGIASGLIGMKSYAGGGGTVSERFIAWEEPHVWAFTATAGAPLFTSIVERITIEPLDERRTSVTYRMALAPRRALLPLLKLGKGQLAKVLATALANLDGEVARRRSLAS